MPWLLSIGCHKKGCCLLIPRLSRVNYFLRCKITVYTLQIQHTAAPNPYIPIILLIIQQNNPILKGSDQELSDVIKSLSLSCKTKNDFRLIIAYPQIMNFPCVIMKKSMHQTNFFHRFCSFSINFEALSFDQN